MIASTFAGFRRHVGAALVAATFVVAVPVVEASAQSGPPQVRQQRSGQPRGDREMEQQVQRRIGAMLKERLSLTDDQLVKLEGVTMKLDRDRRAVRGEEFRLRSAMRRHLLAGDAASNDSVAPLLDRLPALERRKIDLMELEQRELAQFLSPIQRARFMALQEEIRRNMDEIRDKRSPGTPSRPGDRSPHGTPPHGTPPTSGRP